MDCEPDQVTPESFVDVPQKRIRFDYTYDGVMKSYEDSRSRLGIENADILLVHDVDVFSQGSQEKSDAKVRELFEGGGYRALVELRDSGDILAIGVRELMNGKCVKSCLVSVILMDFCWLDAIHFWNKARWILFCHYVNHVMLV